VEAAEGAPFSESERNVLRSFLDLLMRDSSSLAEKRSLSQKLRQLEKQNVELKLINQSLAEASWRDALTGLYNRSYVLDKIEAELQRAERHGAPTSLLMIDLDHFKLVNDSYGHPMGDQVLQAVGRVLKDSCRAYDVPSRYGGEEFCVLLPETDIDNTTAVTERIRATLRMTPLAVEQEETIWVTASIGVAGFEKGTSESLNAASLVDRADRALYAAKRAGRNRVERWNPAVPEPLRPLRFH